MSDTEERRRRSECKHRCYHLSEAPCCFISIWSTIKDQSTIEFGRQLKIIVRVWNYPCYVHSEI